MESAISTIEFIEYFAGPLLFAALAAACYLKHINLQLRNKIKALNKKIIDHSNANKDLNSALTRSKKHAITCMAGFKHLNKVIDNPPKLQAGSKIGSLLITGCHTLKKVDHSWIAWCINSFITPEFKLYTHVNAYREQLKKEATKPENTENTETAEETPSLYVYTVFDTEKHTSHTYTEKYLLQLKSNNDERDIV